MINQVLRNKVYLGILDNFKVEVVNYKTKLRRKTDNSKHVIVNNTHEAIITLDTFNRVQELMEKKFRRPYIRHENLFKSTLFCMGCNRRMTIAYHPLKDGKRSAYYKCDHHFSHKDECVKSNIIYYDVIKKIVIERLKEFIDIVINSKEFETKIKARITLNESNDKELTLKRKIEDRLNILSKLIKKLYEDNISEVIDDNSYHELLKEYLEEKKSLQNELNNKTMNSLFYY